MFVSLTRCWRVTVHRVYVPVSSNAHTARLLVKSLFEAVDRGGLFATVIETKSNQVEVVQHRCFCFETVATQFVGSVMDWQGGVGNLANEGERLGSGGKECVKSTEGKEALLQPNRPREPHTGFSIGPTGADERVQVPFGLWEGDFTGSGL